MRRLAVCICLIMFSGLSVMSTGAGSGRSGKLWHPKNAGAGEADGVSELPGEQGPPRERIEALMQAGKYRKAQHLAEMILDRQEKRLGPEAPEVAACLQRLAYIDMQLEQILKAIGLYQRALQIREKTLGPDHPQTAATQAHLGWAYTERGFYDQALPLLQHSLAIREKVTGPDSLDTAQSLTMLANLQR
jgi:tetratricopeptide (TPR) repeat protein